METGEIYKILNTVFEAVFDAAGPNGRCDISVAKIAEKLRVSTKPAVL
jgi:hypothetical protein